MWASYFNSNNLELCIIIISTLGVKYCCDEVCVIFGTSTMAFAAIDEKISKIPPSSSTVIYQSQQKETTLLPSYAIDYKTTKGNIVHLNPSTFEITKN